MRMEAAREAFTDTILTLARQDPKLFAVATDSRGSVTLTRFADELPAQFVECGIAEQEQAAVLHGFHHKAAQRRDAFLDRGAGHQLFGQ